MIKLHFNFLREYRIFDEHVLANIIYSLRGLKKNKNKNVKAGNKFKMLLSYD